jgi:hypothetical protein
VCVVREGSLLYPASHKHLLSLLATTWDGSSPMLLYPYTEPGNLKKYLSVCHQPVSTHQVTTVFHNPVPCYSIPISSRTVSRNSQFVCTHHQVQVTYMNSEFESVAPHQVPVNNNPKGTITLNPFQPIS